MDGTCEPARFSALRTPGRKKSGRHVNFCIDEPLEVPDSSPLDSSARTPVYIFPVTPFTPIEETGVVGAHSCNLFEAAELRQRPHAEEPGLQGSFSLDLPNLMTPSTMSKEGFEITNTFLNAKR